ncbi:MAG: 30S ribosomal protein S20 [Anaerolineae bacterium]|nr:30S ribosomal protein S20 [Anaerolineae bacterium]
MANTKSAIKNVRKNERRRVHNQIFRSRARTEVKKVRKLIEAGKFEEAQQAIQIAHKALDKAATKGIIHRNNAARRKARLAQQLNRALTQK